MDTTLTALATATHAAMTLRALIESRALYPTDIEHSEAMRLHETLAGEIRIALADEVWSQVRDDYREPKPEDPNPEELTVVVAGGILMLAGRLGMKVDDLTAVLRASFDSASEELKRARARVEEILTFDCRFPHPAEAGEFIEPGRFVVLLGKYWDVYRRIVEQIGTAPIFYSPHPLVRLVVNVQERVKRCLDEVGDGEMSAAVEEILDMPLDDDVNMAWDEWVRPRIGAAQAAFERTRMRMRPRQYPLTQAERLFLEGADLTLADLDKGIAKDWKKILKRMEDAAAKHKDGLTVNREPTCFEYIGKVETALRRVVEENYRRQYGRKWLTEVQRVIGADAYRAAERTMQQRGVTNVNDLLNFAQLKDVHQLMIKRWAIFSNAIKTSPKQFNRWMADILKGRTEEAHNRPEHLWPEIEKQRVRVACHDLLKTIVEEPTSGHPEYFHETAERLHRRIVGLSDRRRRAEGEAAHARALGPDLEGPARAAERDAEMLAGKIADLERIVERVAAGYPYFERSGFEEAVEAYGEIPAWQELSERPASGVVFVHDGVNVRIPIDVQRDYGKAVTSGRFEGFVLCVQFEPPEEGNEVTRAVTYLFGTIPTPKLHNERALFLVGQWEEK